MSASSDDERPGAALLVPHAGYRDEASFLAAFPRADNGDVSLATGILAPLGIAARPFLEAFRADREVAIDLLISASVRRVLRRGGLALAVAIAGLLAFPDPWRFLIAGGAALRAGIDLGRHAARLRALRAVVELEVDVLRESAQPADPEEAEAE